VGVGARPEIETGPDQQRSQIEQGMQGWE
jgi:hypothetical protein